MKKGLFILAAVALVLASCNNDVTIAENQTLADPNQPQEIGFVPINETSKRVLSKTQYAITTTAFPDDNTMEVKAYQTQPTAAAYFDKCTFSKSGETWHGNQYWPLSAAKLNFFAVSGYGVNANAIDIADALATAEVRYTAANGYSQTTQSDIMYAFGRGEVTQPANNLVFPANVPMQFKHALTLIDFEVKGFSATEASAIKVNSITLKGATYNGTLTLTNTNAASVSDAVTTAVSWAAGSEVPAVAVPGISSGTTIATDFARIGNGLMVIPGTDFDSFVINYSLNGNNYDYEYTPDHATIASLVVNKKYTYQITFKLHEILIAPTVANWDNTNYGVTIAE